MRFPRRLRSPIPRPNSMAFADSADTLHSMPPRPPASTRFAVSIDGKAVPAQSPTGGYIKADVKTTFPSANGPPQRQISSFGYTNLQVKLGLEVGTPILNWINAALKGNPVSKNGTLIELDDQNRARAYLDFTNGAISDFVVPGFDGASNAASTFTLEASIVKSTVRPGDNTAVQLPNRLKPFLASNFRVKIDGLPTARVRSVAPLSFPRTNQGIVPTDLTVTFPNVDVGPWRAWADDFIVKGHNGQDKEKQGAIEVLAPNLGDVLATLTIKQIGIFELTPTDDTSIRSHRASMYFEYGQLSFP
jgi:T4-like virus tail tube protein gp19